MPKNDQTARHFPYWRIAHPLNEKMPPGSDKRLYWERGIGAWTELNYTVWTYKEKVRIFGEHDWERNWEGFGFVIPLYDDGEEGGESNPEGLHQLKATKKWLSKIFRRTD
jgi:hypothetical protein